MNQRLDKINISTGALQDIANQNLDNTEVSTGTLTYETPTYSSTRPICYWSVYRQSKPSETTKRGLHSKFLYWFLLIMKVSRRLKFVNHCT